MNSTTKFPVRPEPTYQTKTIITERKGTLSVRALSNRKWRECQTALWDRTYRISMQIIQEMDGIQPVYMLQFDSEDEQKAFKAKISRLGTTKGHGFNRAVHGGGGDAPFTSVFKTTGPIPAGSIELVHNKQEIWEIASQLSSVAAGKRMGATRANESSNIRGWGADYSQMRRHAHSGGSDAIVVINASPKKTIMELSKKVAAKKSGGATHFKIPMATAIELLRNGRMSVLEKKSPSYVIKSIKSQALNTYRGYDANAGEQQEPAALNGSQTRSDFGQKAPSITPNPFTDKELPMQSSRNMVRKFHSLATYL